MRKFLLNVAVISFFLIILSSCSHDDEKFLSEGSIEYSASVVDKTNIVANMAPTKMTIKFKENKSCVEMSAGMGLFSTTFVSDPQSKTLTQMVKLLNKKYWLTENISEINKEIEDYKIEIKQTKEKKLIAGYNCKKAIVHYKEEELPDFEIYYTNDLGIKNPNFANPFAPVEGVLMEYQLKKFGLEMKFVAQKVTNESVDDALFQVPPDYKKISHKEMTELFQGLE